MGYRIQATDAFSLDTALFYNVYNGIRLSRANPDLASSLPAPLLVASQFYNGMDGETYGIELAANWRVTDWWRLHGTYTVLKMNLHADPSLSIAAQRSSGAEGIEGQNPQQQAYLQSSWNLTRDVDFDLMGRYVDRLSGFNPTTPISAPAPGVSDTVGAYFSLDARLAWRPHENIELSVVGQNLLDSHHPEFGTNPNIRSPFIEIRRGVYGMISVKF
jgi:iron complex outermembrane receptor protein